jgi:hypothetical protein
MAIRASNGYPTEAATPGGGTQQSIQYLYDNVANDGDTITLPSGDFNWTERVTLGQDKGIIIQGNTTTGGAGTGTVSPVHNTKIYDFVGTSPPGGDRRTMILVSSRPARNYRITGLTFKKGSTISASQGGSRGTVEFENDETTWGSPPAPSYNNRLDNCYFEDCFQYCQTAFTGWCYGVIDHCIFEFGVNRFVHYNHQNNYGGLDSAGVPYDNGHGAFNDRPRFGTLDFVFMESCTVGLLRRTTNTTYAFIDGTQGTRVVARNNYIINGIVGGHGTEGGVPRGVRAKEVYNNTLEFNKSDVFYNGRSGSALIHDNTSVGTIQPTLTATVNYRQFYARPDPVWGQSNGISIWDTNVTDAVNPGGRYPTLDKNQQSYNEANMLSNGAFIFHTGTATADTAEGTMTDTTHGGTGITWTPGMWSGYSIRHEEPGSESFGMGSWIISNSADSLTYRTRAITGDPVPLIFKAGDHYSIRRVLVTMDQNGGGYTTRKIKTKSGAPVLEASNAVGWCDPQVEPIYAWNNIHNPGAIPMLLTQVPGSPTTRLGTELFNSPDDTQAKAWYNAERNGHGHNGTGDTSGPAYTGTAVFPHPLVQPEAPKPFILISGNLSFGNVNVGSSSQKTATITNNGTANLVITDMTSNLAVFTIATPHTVTLAPGASTTRQVTFTPAAASTYSGTLTVAITGTFGGSNTAALDGVGVGVSATKVLVITGDLLFGNVMRGSVAQRTVNFANTGNAPLTITNLVPDSGISLSWTSTVIQPNGALNLIATADTSTQGAFSGTIAITSDATSGPNHLDFSFTVTERIVFGIFCDVQA